MEIKASTFGSITIDGEKYDHDIVIFPSGIERRKKWITKDEHGTSHKFTRKEMEEYLRKVDTDRIEVVVVGTGQYGRLGLLNGARELLGERGMEVVELETPEVAKHFERREEPRERKLGIFHVTC